MSDPSLNDCSNDTESLEEEIEPKLKYIRLSNDLQSILAKSNATCIAVHPKFICLGVHWGMIYLLDHQGNLIEGKKLKGHTVAVNQISIDLNGDYIATCSDDGKVFIYGLFTQENNVNLNVERLVKTVALDPFYYKAGYNRRFITGDDKLTLYERTFLGGLKSTVLCESEGFVRSLSWGENFIAWSSNIGVRVYDINARCSLGLIKWEEHPGIAIEKFRCNLRWADSRTLLIGWVDTVRVCVIRKRNSIEIGNRELPEYLVDPVSTFQTEFYICGVAPLDHQLVLLGFSKELDSEQKSLRPQLYIAEYRDNEYNEICADSLSLRGYEEYSVNDYHLDVLIEENRFFIVAPRDVVIASPYDLDDRIQWLMQHNKFDEALEVLAQNDGRHSSKFNIHSVGIAYLDHLIAHRSYDTAGKLCMKIFGNNKTLWEDQICKFAAVHQLRAVSPYIPNTVECKLKPHFYEVILYEYLKMDAQGFLELVKKWDPNLYNTCAIINAVLEHISMEENKTIYFEALAWLYSYQKNYDKSLSLYLKLKHKDVFTLIKRHKLYNMVQDLLIELMDLDVDITIALIIDENRIPSETVIKKLNNHQQYLYKYLDAFNKKDRKGQYHRQLIKLYAVFDRNKLLPLLQTSDHYPIQEALDICQKEKYYPEMVYLLDRIGDTKEAFQLITKELKDMQKAITFCQEHDDPDLWNDLINYSLDKPEYITYLLQSIGAYVDPTILLEKIEDTKEIQGLKGSLIRMLYHYNLQVSVQEGCKKIVVSDYFNLHQKLVRLQQKGVAVSNEMVCGVCNQPVIARDIPSILTVIIFNCKHAFHKQCLSVEASTCQICYPVKKNT